MDVVAIAGGGFHNLSLKMIGTVWAWGFNLYGQLGNGTTTDNPKPVPVNLNNAAVVAAGREHSLALVLANTPRGANVVVKPVDAKTGATPVTVTFSSVSQAGMTSVTTSGTGLPPPAGFMLGTGYYYELTTTATFSGPVTVCIDYSGTPLAGTTTQPAFKHYDPATMTWATVTVLSWNQANNIICGTVSSLSPFALFSAVPKRP